MSLSVTDTEFVGLSTKVIYPFPLAGIGCPYPYSLAQMVLNKAISRALRELAEQAAKEEDPDTLRTLILGLNSVLDVIEKRIAELEPDDNPPIN